MKDVVLVFVLMCLFLLAIIMWYVDAVITGIIFTRNAYGKNNTLLFGLALTGTIMTIFPITSILGFIGVSAMRIYYNITYKERWKPFVLTALVLPAISILLMVGTLCAIIVMYVIGLGEAAGLFTDFLQSITY